MWNRRCKKTLLLSICCFQFTSSALAGGQEDLAVLWAPVLDQFYNTAGNSSQSNPAQEDTSTLFNFDLDWRANNNWDNLNYYNLKPPVVYYSVAETAKYVYLGYYFYYPRHLGSNSHGNDFVGLALALEKLSAKGQGRLAGVLLYDGEGWQKIGPGELRAADVPVRVVISAGEHIPALRDGDSPPPGNAITSKPPTSLNSGMAADCYQLLSLDEIWRHRAEIQAGEVYGTLDGKAGAGDLKDLPWKWKYKNARWLTDPAAVFRLITGNKTFTGGYLSNPYTEKV